MPSDQIDWEWFDYMSGMKDVDGKNRLRKGWQWSMARIVARELTRALFMKGLELATFLDQYIFKHEEQHYLTNKTVILK